MQVNINRRDVLKAAVASLVAGVAGTLTRCTSIANRRKIGMKSKPLMTVRIVAAPAQMLGSVAQGTRSVVPVTGGAFEGPQLRGTVLPGGGDWLLLRSDAVLELDLRITLETDDHALIYMTFQGMRHGQYFRTFPRFETSAEKYAFLNRIVTVGVGEVRPDGAIHTIEEIL